MIVLIAGTRPEIIKLAPIVKQLEKKGIEHYFIHTGQHYDYEMSRIFMEELEIKPYASFQLKSNEPVLQTGEMIYKIGKLLQRISPKVSIVQGDTNTTLAGAIASIKLGLLLAHVEAGWRSYDLRMPEEYNRRLVDHMSNILFAPSELAKENLVKENVFGKIYVVGSTVIDAINMYFSKINEIETKVMSQIKFPEYILVTFHRAENVDNPEILKEFIKILRYSPYPVVFPLHPRTRKRLNEFGLLSQLQEISHLQILPPQGYFEFLALLKNSKLVLTDSGGIIEEATHPKIRKYVLVLRTSFEKWESIYAGFAKLVGIDHEKVIKEIKEKTYSNLPDTSPFGNGDASQKIIEILQNIVNER